MLTKAFVTAAAAGLLAASAAHAGGDHVNKTAEHHDRTSATASTTVNPTTSTWNSSTSTLTADTGMSSNVSATVPMSTADALALGGTVQIITSTPVADTPENRALYGQPLSMSGKRTRPAGN